MTDRLAYLHYVQGTISSNLAGALEQSRGALKAARNAECTARFLAVLVTDDDTACHSGY